MDILELIIIILLIIANIGIVIYFNIKHRKDLKHIEELKLEHIEEINNLTKTFIKRFESMRIAVIDGEIHRNKQWSKSESMLNEVLNKTRTVMENISNKFFNNNTEIDKNLLIINEKINKILKNDEN